MKYGTIIFTKVLGGLFQQGYISAEKKGRFLTEWTKGTKENDEKLLEDLIRELLTVNTNAVWKKELEQVLENFKMKQGGTTNE